MCPLSVASRRPFFHHQTRNWITWTTVSGKAIALAKELGADLHLLDDADARKQAARRNLPFIGTLGVLRKAAQLDLLDLSTSLARLQQTAFYVDPELIRSLLEEDARRKM